METPKVTDREKEMYGEYAARYTSGYNSYMKEKENAETPQQLETIEKRFKQFEDTFDSKTIGVALRLMDEEREKNFLGGILKKFLKLKKRSSPEKKDTSASLEEMEKYLTTPNEDAVSFSKTELNKIKKEVGDIEDFVTEFYNVRLIDDEIIEKSKALGYDKEKTKEILTGPTTEINKLRKEYDLRIKKAPGGKAFPDLTGDGKVTQADILKGRGVFGHGGESSMSILVPMERMPVDTYPNIPPEEMEEALESQLPDDEMEDKYIDYILSESLSDDEQEYLMDALEKDERLSDIMDKVITVAGEFTGEGEVKGPGTGVSDSIPARLSDGEFVFTRKATDQIGAEKLQRMMDDAERDYDKGELKKMAFGGMNQMMDDPTMDDRRRRQVDMFGIMPEDEQEEEIKRQMISSNRMPSVR